MLFPWMWIPWQMTFLLWIGSHSILILQISSVVFLPFCNKQSSSSSLWNRQAFSSQSCLILYGSPTIISFFPESPSQPAFLSANSSALLDFLFSAYHGRQCLAAPFSPTDWSIYFFRTLFKLTNMLALNLRKLLQKEYTGIPGTDAWRWLHLL